MGFFRRDIARWIVNKMKRLLACAAGLLLSAPVFNIDVAKADTPLRFAPLGYCQLSGISAATGFSSCSGGIPSAASTAQICVETQAVRYRDDGTAPTGSVGMPTASGTCFSYTGDIGAIQFIPETGSATIDVSFYR
jgi:hypothetical protein